MALRVAQRDAARVARAGTPRAYSGHGSRVASTVEFGDSIPLREILAELSAALRVGERTLSNWLGDGAALVGTYSATLEALRTGRIDERHAAAIIDAGAALDPEHRAEYEALILAVAEVETAPAVREYAKVVAARIQPDILVENQRRALAERRVRAFDLGETPGPGHHDGGPQRRGLQRHQAERLVQAGHHRQIGSCHQSMQVGFG